MTLVTCMYGYHCDKCRKLRYLERNIFGGGGGEPTIRWRAKIIKGNQGGTRAGGGETKRKLSNFFSVFRRPEFGSTKIKVDLLDESYE